MINPSRRIFYPDHACQHNDHCWIVVGGESWAIQKKEDNLLHLWRGYEPNIEYAQFSLDGIDMDTYCKLAAEWLSDTSDIPEADEDWFKKARLVKP